MPVAAPAKTDPITGEQTTRLPPSLTNIVATLGPSTDDPDVLRKVIEHGATIFRLNFSHGDFADHERRLKLVRRLSEETATPLAVLGDLPGPKIRVGRVPERGIELDP
ncbi:MAG: pyruvate kinase, partial [Planctomycetota bacterium]|nr:pyruvate kinase [Planctomycetota bacterium]